MKKLLFSAAAVLALSGIARAQNIPPEYSWEVGLNGGYSVNTTPVGPAEQYRGTRTEVVKDYSLRLNYYINPNWMLNLDIGNRRWQTWGDWQLTGLFGRKLESREVSFLIADHAITQSVGINYVIPFYTEFQNFNRANINFGALVGAVTTVNDGSQGYGTYKTATDSGYTYLNSYHYGYGIGFSLGLQMGFTYYVIPRLGANIDLGVRYVNVNTNDQNYRAMNSHYRLLYFPATVGLRWRF